VDPLGVDGVGQRRQHLDGVAPGQQQVAAAFAVPRPQRSEGVEHERDPRGRAVCEHVVVEDEDGTDRAVGGGRRQRPVVRRPEVATVPVDLHTRV